MYKRKIVTVFVFVMIVSVLLIATPRQTKSARFYLASWDYPDEYGQGIVEISLYQNMSGSWESLTPFGHLSTGVDVFEINETATGVRIVVKCWLNNTMVNAATLLDGRNYLRHNVSLTMIGDISATSIFSQQNFTHDSSTDSQDPMYYYIYSVNMAFTPQGGQEYLARVYCDIYWGELP